MPVPVAVTAKVFEPFSHNVTLAGEAEIATASFTVKVAAVVVTELQGAVPDTIQLY